MFYIGPLCCDLGADEIGLQDGNIRPIIIRANSNIQVIGSVYSLLKIGATCRVNSARALIKSHHGDQLKFHETLCLVNNTNFIILLKTRFLLVLIIYN